MTCVLATDDGRQTVHTKLTRRSLTIKLDRFEATHLWTFLNSAENADIIAKWPTVKALREHINRQVDERDAQA